MVTTNTNYNKYINIYKKFIELSHGDGIINKEAKKEEELQNYQKFATADINKNGLDFKEWLNANRSNLNIENIYLTETGKEIEAHLNQLTLTELLNLTEAEVPRETQRKAIISRLSQEMTKEHMAQIDNIINEKIFWNKITAEKLQVVINGLLDLNKSNPQDFKRGIYAAAKYLVKDNGKYFNGFIEMAKIAKCSMYVFFSSDIPVNDLEDILFKDDGKYFNDFVEIARASGNNIRSFFVSIPVLKELMFKDNGKYFEMVKNGLVEMAQVAGFNVNNPLDSGYIFLRGISTLKDLMIKDDGKHFEMVKNGLVEMAQANKGDVKYIFVFGVGAVKDLMIKDDGKYFEMVKNGLIEMVKVNEGKTYDLFRYSISAVKELLTKDDGKYFEMVKSGLVEMATATGDKSDKLFRHGVPAVKDLLIKDNGKHFDLVKNGLIEMANNSKGGKYCGFFESGIPAVKELLIKDNGKHFGGFVEMAKTAGSKAESLFRYGIPALEDLLTKDDGKYFEMVKDGLIKMAKATGDSSWFLFRDILPPIKNLITVNNFNDWAHLVTLFKKLSLDIIGTIADRRTEYTIETVNIILEKIKVIGTSAIDTGQHKVQFNYKNTVQRSAEIIDIDCRECDLQLETDFKHVKVKNMHSYAFRRRGLSVKVNPVLKDSHKVMVYNKGTLLGVYDIPASGNINEIKAFFPKAAFYNMQIYLVKKELINNYLTERTRKRKVMIDGAIFLTINNFHFIESKPDNVLSYIYNRNLYNCQYFYDEENIVSPEKRKEINKKTIPFSKTKTRAMFKALISSDQEISLNIEKIKESKKSKFMKKILLQSILKQTELNNKLKKDPKYNKQLYYFLGCLKGNETSIAKFNCGKEIFKDIYYNFISETLLTEQYLSTLPDDETNLSKKNWINKLLAIVPNIEQYIGNYYSPGNTEKMFLAVLLNTLYPGVYPENVFTESVPVVENAYFDKCAMNSSGSYDLKYHFQEHGKAEEVVTWKNAFPGTLILRPLHGAAFAASIFPGNLEHGIIFAGINSEGKPMALSHPYGYSELSKQITGKRPSMIKFVQVDQNDEMMKNLGKKAVKAAQYLMEKKPKFDMYDPALPFKEENKIKDENSEFGHYYNTMYCFMMIIKAYELAGYDISNIDEYNLNFYKLLSLTKTDNSAKQAYYLTRIVASLSLDDKEKLSKKDAVMQLIKLFRKPDFPGFKDTHILASWLKSQDYADRDLLIKLLYYTGEEIVNGQNVQVIKPSIKIKVK